MRRVHNRADSSGVRDGRRAGLRMAEDDDGSGLSRTESHALSAEFPHRSIDAAKAREYLDKAQGSPRQRIESARDQLQHESRSVVEQVANDLGKLLKDIISEFPTQGLQGQVMRNGVASTEFEEVRVVGRVPCTLPWGESSDGGIQDGIRVMTVCLRR